MTHRKDKDAGNQPAKRTAISTLALGREMPRARKSAGQGCAAANTAPGAQANPRRAPGRAGPLLALVLGALACLTASAPALAANLVGNSPLAKGASADEHVQVLTSGWLAQPFSTGSNSGGYSVSNVKVGSYSGARFSVEICETTNALTYNDRGDQNEDIRGFPVTSTCKAFSTPGFASKGQEWRIENYTPSSTLTLGADKHYLVLMKLNDNRVIQVHPNGQHPFEWEHFTIQGTRSLSQSGTTGWTIWDYFASTTFGTSNWVKRKSDPSRGGNRVLRIQIDGAAVSSQNEAPTIVGSPGLKDPGTDGWTPNESTEVTLTFSEAVNVVTTNGTPSVTLQLSGGSEERSATYTSGSGTTELVFAYTLTDADGSHSSMFVEENSLTLNGGTIKSKGSSANAALAHVGAASAVTIVPRTPPTPFTASFSALPSSHNGADKFSVELRFSEEPQGLSYSTVGGSLLNVTGASVNTARRLTAGNNRGWEVTVAPSQAGDITIRLPARACTETNAICVGGRALASAVSATVPGVVTVPFTASFSGVPAEHDGSTAFEMRFHLSAEPTSLSYRTVQNGLFNVTGASIEKASRLTAGKNSGWSLRVEPAGTGDVTVRVNATTACNTTPGVCAADGRKLSGGLQAIIAGPATLSVADAEVDEAEGATLDFVVTLSKSRYTATTVGYSTSDGTATAGSDYTATSGTVSFGPLETSKTVSVLVLDDAHDEGSETMMLTLSNASGARLGDATATGTINNHDAMPKAWMLRFGRTVGSQVVDALTQRLEGAGGSHVTVAGINLAGAKGDEPTLTDGDPFGLPAWAIDAEREANTRTITADDLLLRSAFHLSSGGDGMQGAGPAFTAWGRVSSGGFEAEEKGVTMDGKVTTGLVGFDAEWERTLAGVMLSQSSGDGAYRFDPALGNDAGTVESSLTGVYPYARVDLNAKVSAWALAGMGSGELTLHQEGGKPMRADISMRMGAVGVKGQVLDSSGPSGVGLNVKSDAMWVGTKSERSAEMVGTEGDVTRLRLIVQGERVFETDNGGTFTPSAEIGLRHDGGDAETGSGVEVGAGLRYTAGPLTIEAEGRTLVAHEASGYEEWGMSAAIRVTPSPSGRGLTLSIAPAWGHTGSATNRLWSAQDARALGADSEFEATGRLEMDAGYGFGLPHGHGVLTPYAGLTLGEAGTRVRTGTRWQLSPNTVVGLEATRQTSDASEPDNQVRLRAALRF